MRETVDAQCHKLLDLIKQTFPGIQLAVFVQSFGTPDMGAVMGNLPQDAAAELVREWLRSLDN